MKGFFTPAIALIVGTLLIGVPFAAWYTATPEPQVAEEPAVGGFGDTFLSLQLAPDPDNGECLTTDGTDNVWSTSCGGSSGATTLDGLNDVTITSSSTGNLLYLAGSGQWINLATGSDGQVLKLASGVPSWDTDNTAAGGSGLGTTTPWTAGQLAVVATDGDVKSVATSTLSENISGLEFDANPWIVGSARTLSLSSGYVIPLTASTTEWHNKVSSQWGTSGSNIYYSAGNVGIGTTSPLTKFTVTDNNANFEVSGNSNATYDGVVLQAIDRQGTGRDDLNLFTAGGSLKLFTASTERLRITNTGNVGIGTSTPVSRLAIQTTGTTDILNLFETGGTEVLTVLESGNVGIGTTTPGSLLTVAGTAEVTGAATLRSTLNVTGNTTLANASTTNLTVSTNSYLGTVRSGTWNGSTIGETYGGTGQTTYATGDILYASGSNTLAKRTIGSTGDILLVSGGVPTWTATSSLGLGASFFEQNGNSFGTTATLGTNDSNNLAFETGGTTRVTIDTSGNVGIGTTTPSHKLQVTGSIRFATDGTGGGLLGLNGSGVNLFSLTRQSNDLSITSFDAIGFAANKTSGPSTSYDMVIDNGNIGIGTTSPASKLHVVASNSALTYAPAAQISAVFQRNGDNGISILATDSTQSFINFGDLASESVGRISYNHSNNSLGFVTNGSARVTVDSNGNVGIGTTSPSAKLTVVGDLSLQTIAASTTARLFEFSGTGNDYTDIQVNSSGDVSFVADDGSIPIQIGGASVSVGSDAVLFSGEIMARGDTDTYISFPADTVRFTAGGTNLLTLNGGSNISTGIEAWDFGGASLFEIPNGTNPTANDPGEIAHDTTDNQLILDDFVIATEVPIFGFQIASTSAQFASGTVIKIPQQRLGYTVQSILCYVTSGTSKVIHLFGETLTCSANGAEDDGAISSATVTAKATTTTATMGAESGTVNAVNISVFGTWTRQ